MLSTVVDRVAGRVPDRVVDRAVDRVVEPGYDAVREYLPRKIVACNGVPVRRGRLFDRQDVRTAFKPVAMATLRREVEPDDDVLIVGGGHGVGAVVAARRILAGSGQVTVYEASAEHCEHVRETAAINNVGDQITIEHCLVGDAVDVWGETAGSTVRSPADVPATDVLYVDVEGAELSVLDGLGPRPSRLIVEYHPDRGVTREAVITALDELGYAVQDTDVDSPEIVGERR